MNKKAKQLVKLAKEHDIDGGKQATISAWYGDGNLFEFMGEEAADLTLAAFKEKGVETILQKVEESYEEPESSIKGKKASAVSPLPSTVEVYDAEAGKVIKRSPEQQKKSQYLFKLIEDAEMMKYIVLTQFFDNKGWLDKGYATKTEFCEEALGESIRTTQQKIKSAARFAGVLPPFQIPDDNSKHEHVFALDGLSEDEKANFKKASSVGLRKWYEIARMDEADFSEVLTEAIVTFKDGREVSLEDVHVRSVRDLRREFAEANQALTERLNKVNKKKDEAEADTRLLKSEMENLQERVGKAEKLEQVYGPKKTALNLYYERLQTVRHHLEAMGKVLVKIKFTEEDYDIPPDLVAMLVGVRHQLEGHRTTLINNNRDFIWRETETLPADPSEYNLGGLTVDENGRAQFDTRENGENETVNPDTGEILND